VGRISERVLLEIRPQKGIMGMRALSVVGGLTGESMLDASTGRLTVQSGMETVLAAGRSTCGKIPASFVAQLSKDAIATHFNVPHGTHRGRKRERESFSHRRLFSTG